MDLTPAPAHTCLGGTAPAVHLCTVPASGLVELTECHPVVDLGRYECGRRQVGRLLAASRCTDGAIAGSLELRWSKPDPNAPGRLQHRTSVTSFRLENGHGRVTAHLPTDLLESLPQAFDVEFG